jgi:hypothetical protein
MTISRPFSLYFCKFEGSGVYTGNPKDSGIFRKNSKKFEQKRAEIYQNMRQKAFD